MTAIKRSTKLIRPATETFSLHLTSSSLSKIEETVIREVLHDKDWNLTQAAEALGIARGTLYSKIKSYNLEKP